MNRERHDRLTEVLEQILPVLVSQYQPERIILFGSLVQGTVGEWSDLDLLFIKETSKPFFQRLKEVALLCRAPVGVDFLVYTPAEVVQMLAERNPFIEEVFRTGRVLYERQPAEAVA